MTLEPIRELYAYDHWATNAVLRSLDSLSHDEYMKDMRSSHGGVHGTLVHLLAGDRVWLDRWTSASQPVFPRSSDYPDLTGVARSWAGVQERTATFIETLTDERLLESFTYADSKGNSYSEILWYSMVHKVTHATYHRGQIVTLIRQLGKKPVSTDLVFWRRSLITEGQS